MLVLVIMLATGVTAACRDDSGDTSTAPRTPDATASDPVELTVAAAADLQAAFTEIGTQFEQRTGHHVVFNFGSTGQLAAQIGRGAPFDVFAAANEAFVDDLIASGDVLADSKLIYAIGRIVLANNTRYGIQADELSDLRDERVHKIAIADPEHAPYGVAAREALQHAGLWDELRPKIVYADNVRAALQLVQLGEAEAGIIALSIANVPEITFTPIDEALHTPLVQAIGVVSVTKHEQAARDFVNFVTGPEGGAILQRYGFNLPSP